MPATSEAVRALYLVRVAHKIEQAIIEVMNRPRYEEEYIHGTRVVRDNWTGTSKVYCKHPFIFTDETVRQIVRQAEGE